MRGPQSRSDQILEKIIVPVLGSVLIVTAWPAVLVWFFKGRRKEKV
jgi:hypothetical protein